MKSGSRLPKRRLPGKRTVSRPNRRLNWTIHMNTGTGTWEREREGENESLRDYGARQSCCIAAALSTRDRIFSHPRRIPAGMKVEWWWGERWGQRDRDRYHMNRVVGIVSCDELVSSHSQPKVSLRSPLLLSVSDTHTYIYIFRKSRKRELH